MSDQTLVNESAPIPLTDKDGHTMSATLKRLTIREVFKFVHHIRENRSVALVSLTTGRTEEWVDDLSDDSFGELSKESIKLNFQRAVTISDKDPVMAQLIGPIVANMIGLIQASESMLTGLNSQKKSPEPPLSESVPETGNG